jgi:TPR repeat protein
MTGFSDAVGGQKLRAFFGSMDARNALAWRYREGQGVPLDFSKAANWFEKAANAGSSKAQFDLGILYYYGLGVPAQFDTAFNWFDRAAKQNYGPAVTMLGLIAMEDGQESPQAAQKPYAPVFRYAAQDERNLKKAIELWRRAVSLNDPFAEYLLGTAYLDLASGIRQSQPEETTLAGLREKEHNLVRALFWFEKAKRDGVNPVGGMLQNVWATVPDEAFARVMDKVDLSLEKGIEP